MQWLIWGALLLAQNASFTWVSRARNSSSILYHGIASIFSNGIFFVNLMVNVNMISSLGSADIWHKAAIVGFYTLFTVVGSVSMHHFLMKKVEKGKRKIGS